MFTTSFGVVERALWQAYSVPEAARGAFRSRLTSLQKQGLFGAKNMPGKGKELVYTPDMVHRAIFVCEMFEFGVSPREVLDLVEKAWSRDARKGQSLSKIFAEAELEPLSGRNCKPSLDDVIMHMGGVHLMANGWADTVPNVNWCPFRELPRFVKMWMELEPTDPHPSNLPPRALLVNLSARLRTFHAAFADSHMGALPERAEEPKRKPPAPRRTRRG